MNVHIHETTSFHEVTFHEVTSPLCLHPKWMSPESIEHSFFDERTDVWSFGITIWEIFNFGSIPWNKGNSGYQIDSKSPPKQYKLTD